MPIVRPLGTMITYGFSRGHLDADLQIARSLGVSHVEILPDWRNFPDPVPVRKRLDAEGQVLWSAHGSWGGRSVEADRVDLADLDQTVRRASVRDLIRCLDWIAEAGGACLVVHPGGLSSQADFAPRRASLAESLTELANVAALSGVIVCVENMPPRVSPGSRTTELASLLLELNRPELALAIDTGHAHLVSSPAEETRAAGKLLFTTHVHDNDGKRDTHLPPGLGSISWDAWRDSLDEIGYTGPIMLECIRHLRERPDSMNDRLREQLKLLTRS